jgi:hypothetical protein
MDPWIRVFIGVYEKVYKKKCQGFLLSFNVTVEGQSGRQDRGLVVRATLPHWHTWSPGRVLIVYLGNVDASGGKQL